MISRNCLFVTTILASAYLAPAYAQSSPLAAPATDAKPVSDDIIVTAQRRAERTQDVPISITSLDSQALDQANVHQLSDVVKLSPAVRFDYQSSFVQPSIRGVGSAIVSSGSGANVGIYVDGFYSPNPQAGDIQLLNLEGIQVLKGPQGTLFGRNTTGGAILVTTTKPSHATKAVIEASYGRFNAARTQAYLTGGITDNIAADVEVGYRRGDGYLRNIVPDGPKHPGGYENWSARVGLDFTLSDNLSLLVRYSHQSVDDSSNAAASVFNQPGFNWAPLYGRPSVNPAAFPTIPTGYRDVAVSRTGPVGFKMNADVVQATADLDVGFATLTSYTQYRNEKSDTLGDQDQTGTDVFYSRFAILDTTFTQELLLASKPGGPLQWTAGLFYFNYKDILDPIEFGVDRTTLVGVVGSRSTTESFAAYADVTYEALDNLFVTAGARYTHDNFRDASVWFLDPSSGGRIDINYPALKGDRFTPRAVLRYELSDRSSIYGSYTKGYKAALVDVIGGSRVKPETMDSFEVGFKYASRAFSFNLASWYYNYKNLQISIFPRNLSQIKNAASARIYGLEGDMRYQFTPDFEVTVGAAYVNAKYKQFPDGSQYELCDNPGPVNPAFGPHPTFGCGAPGDPAGAWGFFPAVSFDASGRPIDQSGFQMQRAPKLTTTVGARYTIDLGEGKLSLAGNYYHTSSFFFDVGQQFPQDSYDLLGLRAEWTDPSDRYTVAVYGDNVTGTRYYNQVIAHQAGIGGVWGAPTTYGISFRAKY